MRGTPQAIRTEMFRGRSMQGDAVGRGPVIEAGVNITVRLPVTCTAVDYGTAFDITGNAIADSRS